MQGHPEGVEQITIHLNKCKQGQSPLQGGPRKELLAYACRYLKKGLPQTSYPVLIPEAATRFSFQRQLIYINRSQKEAFLHRSSDSEALLEDLSDAIVIQFKLIRTTEKPVYNGHPTKWLLYSENCVQWSPLGTQPAGCNTEVA